MTSGSPVEFAEWCLRSGHLVGLDLRHNPSATTTCVTAVSLRVVHGDPLDLSVPYFVDNARQLLNTRDLARLSKAWEAEMRTIHERAAAVERLRRLLAQARSQTLAYRSVVAAPRLQFVDERLARCWMPGSESERDRRKMLSARAAEHVAVAFYRSFAFDVADISILQVESPGPGDWRQFDLLVDGVPVDVKNTRRSSRSAAFSTLCIPSFKTSRSGDAVMIAGVLSPMSKFDSDDEPGQIAQFLGETSLAACIQLEQIFRTSGIELPLARGLRAAKFLPPWMFSFRPEMHIGRADALRQLESTDLLIATAERINCLPAFVGAKRLELAERLALTDSERRLVMTLVERVSGEGALLPTIFLSILEHFVDSIRKNAPPATPEECRRVLFDSDNYHWPLYVFDPLATVSQFVDTLSSAWQYAHDRLLEFRVFRLQALNILQGKHSNEEIQWTTLMAYCGGFAAGRACREWPLVIGPQQNCGMGKLICPTCAYCCQWCRDVRRMPPFQF